MKDFIADNDRCLLERHGLLDFSAFWTLQLPVIDSPNLNRGGWSHVCRLELEGHGFYLKRQCNHMTKSFAHPFGEPTLAREFHNIQRYRKLGIPAIEAAFYAERQVMEKGSKSFCAVLLSHALDGWHDLGTWFSRWDEMSSEERDEILIACGGGGANCTMRD